MEKKNPYRALGTFDGVSYVQRSADRQLLDEINNNSYTFCLSPRQSGKSSLINHTIKNLPKSVYISIFIDLSFFSNNILKSYDSFMFRIQDEIIKQIGNEYSYIKPKETDVRNIKNDVNLKFENTLKNLLSERDKIIVIFIDEIDLLFNTAYKDNFFGTIRSLYNKRVSNKKFYNVQFHLFGAPISDQLISNKNVSPFNIANKIILKYFNKKETKQICSYLEAGPWTVSEDIYQCIYKNTSGNVYLTQLILENLWKQSSKMGVKEITIDSLQKTINTIIEDSPHIVHFKNIYNCIINDPIILSSFIEQVRGEKINKIDCTKLELIGISSENNKFKNKIYQDVYGRLKSPLSLISADKREYSTKKFSILYIDDGTDTYDISALLNQSFDDICLTKISNIIDLEEALEQDFFDLIITDLFLSNTNINNDKIETVYSLNKIIKKIRYYDGSTPIAVFSKCLDVFLERYTDDLGQIDYIWDKLSTPQKLILWHIKKVKSSRQTISTEYILVDKALNIFENKDDYINNEYLNCLRGLRKIFTSKNEVSKSHSKIIYAIKQLSLEMEFGYNFDRYLKDISFENSNVASLFLPKQEMLNNSLILFLYGFTILNSGLFDIKSIYEQLFPELQYNHRTAMKEINQIWFLTSFFHNVGKIVQDFYRSKCYFHNIIASETKKCENCTHGNCEDQFDSFIKNPIYDVFDFCDLKFLNEIMNNSDFSKSRLSNGIISANILKNYFKSSNVAQRIIEHAAFCVLFNYNFIKGPVYKLPNINFDEYPILSLLNICSMLQFGKKMQIGLSSEIQLERIELSTLNFDINQKKCNIEITFFSSSEIAHSDAILFILKDHLSRVLEEINKAIKKITVGPKNMFSIDAIFRLEGIGKIFYITLK